MEETFETGLSEKCMKTQQVETDKSRQTSRDQHDNALMMGIGTSDGSVVIARSLELMPPHGQKSGVREAGGMVVYVLYTWGI